MDNAVFYLKLDTSHQLKWFEDIFVELIEERAGQKVREQEDSKTEYYQQEFLKRYFESFISIKILYEGAMLEHNSRKYTISLLPAVMTLLRSCLENYALYYYIYLNASSHDETIFRFKCWWREGLIRRQAFQTNESQFLNKQGEEKKNIEKLLNEIKNTEFYHKLSKNEKNKLVNNGSWIFKSYKSLLQIAGFSEQTAANIYGYFSSFAHTSSAGLMQTAQADISVKKEMQEALIKPFLMATGSYLLHFSRSIESSVLKSKDLEFLSAWQMIMGMPM